MVTSVQIDYLNDYVERLELWLGHYRPCHKNRKNKGKLNTNQIIDDEDSFDRRVRVVEELLSVRREIESLKISSSILKLNSEYVIH